MLSTWTQLVYIIAASSLAGNAAATGSVLLAEHQQIVITDNPITLLVETIFFLSIALIVLVKLLDKVIRGRENRKYEGGTKSNSENGKSNTATEARLNDRAGQDLGDVAKNKRPPI